MAIKRGFRWKTQFTPEKKCEENPQAIPISQVKRVKRETAPTSDSAQFILAWRSEDSVEKRKKPPKRSPARRIRWLRGGATRVSSRLFLDAATRPCCPEALFLFFSGKLSLPLCARLHRPTPREDQPDAVSEAKTSFHRAKEAVSLEYLGVRRPV